MNTIRPRIFIPQHDVWICGEISPQTGNECTRAEAHEGRHLCAIAATFDASLSDVVEVWLTRYEGSAS